MEEIHVLFQNEEAAAKAVSRIAEWTASFYCQGCSLRILPLPGKEAELRRLLKGEDIFPSSPS